MRKWLLLYCFIFLFATQVKATHIVGGELGYTFVEKIINENNDSFYVYLVIMRVNKSVNASGVLPPGIVLNVYTQSTSQFVLQKAISLSFTTPMPVSTTLPCTTVPKDADYQVGVYSDTIMVAASPLGYVLTAGSCCRVQNLQNVNNSINIGATYSATIPPQTNALTEYNSTPSTDDSIKVICKDGVAIFSLPFFDADGDLLKYEFCSAYNVDNEPPFTPLVYAAGFSGSNPLGGNPQVVIDSVTGIIRGLVEQPGDYVVCFCLHEFRHGIRINTYRKEFQYRVQLCETASSLPEKYISCDDLSVSFVNDNNPAYQFRWDFGVASSLGDTSRSALPVFSYPDTGRYRVQLIVGRNTLCTDTSYSDAIVYPVLRPDFAFPPMICSGNRILFTGTSSNTYGQEIRWNWAAQYPLSQPFGNAGTSHDLIYRFPTRIGADTLARVKLLVETSKGCVDSVVKLIPVTQSPVIKAGPDLNFCLGDRQQLAATCSSTSLHWEPVTFLSNAAIMQPLANPPFTSTYALIAGNGYCTDADSITIFVTPRPFPDAGNDTVLCFGDSIGLHGIGGQVAGWSPAAGLDDFRLRSPMASPHSTTMYVLSVKDTLGCNRVFRDSVLVKVIPPLRVQAGRDSYTVINQPVRLIAMGAPFFQWSPPYLLDNPSGNSPLANLSRSQTFYLRGYTAEGCEGFDTVTIKLLEHEPDIFVPSAFSPNGDGLNDVLRPVGFGVEVLEMFAVYNRLGQQLFATSVIGNGWDGFYKGKKQPAGAYVWQLRARDFRNKVIEKKGTVILL